MSPREILSTFTIDSIPDLDVAVLGALDLFAETQTPWPMVERFKRPLVVGSGNGAVAGRLLFSTIDAVFADESCYQETLHRTPYIDGAILVSASGDKSAVGIDEYLKQRGLPVILLTDNPHSPAGAILDPADVHVFAHNREPYTYNTSTYLGMLLSKDKEDPKAIHDHITQVIDPLIPKDLSKYDSFFFTVPTWGEAHREMFTTKFDELFGSRVTARAFTHEQTKHAKTVVPSDTEFFISLGDDGKDVGPASHRLVIPLPAGQGAGALMMIGYYVIGQIQKQNPPYFKQNIARYCEEISHVFGHTLTPIVE
jgi:hypothetical protein